jgi:hypothetical protein
MGGWFSKKCPYGKEIKLTYKKGDGSSEFCVFTYPLEDNTTGLDGISIKSNGHVLETEEYLAENNTSFKKQLQNIRNNLRDCYHADDERIVAIYQKNEYKIHDF